MTQWNVPARFNGCLALVMILGFVASPLHAAPKEQPNLIFILADDLGYGDLGSYGQRLIKTPRLDRMAREGLRFTQFYAGSTVCAPSRCVLMTGLHLGHCKVRGNGSGPEQALGPVDVTVADVLSGAGYSTALIGKWGLGDMRPGTEQGMPNRQGFDYFFGYANQVHAHNYYPDFLWRDETRVSLPNELKLNPKSYGGFTGGAATKRVVYSHDLFAEESLQWIQHHQDDPFFLYLALTIPHANNEGASLFGDGAEVPDYGPYAETDWPNQDKGQAAMITRMDRDVGRILDLLTELGIAKETLVIFSSDNGPHDESRHRPERFAPGGPLRGMKRDLYEGGIRVPTIAWWPGTVQPGRVSDHVGYFGDLIATAGDLTGAKIPKGLDSISFLPTLKGRGKQKSHKYLYWEFYERGGSRALLWGDWKAVRPRWSADIELFNLKTDLSEGTNVASEHPEVVKKITRMMEQAHNPSPDWTPPNPKSSN